MRRRRLSRGEGRRLGKGQPLLSMISGRGSVGRGTTGWVDSSGTTGMEVDEVGGTVVTLEVRLFVEHLHFVC